jgi:hypothetical protein
LERTNAIHLEVYWFSNDTCRVVTSLLHQIRLNHCGHPVHDSSGWLPTETCWSNSSCLWVRKTPKYEQWVQVTSKCTLQIEQQ